MRMHVNKTKRIAVLGVMAALSTVLTLLGTVISVNTVFFTAAAAFLAGLAVCIYGMGSGTVFFLVCLTLDFFVNPDKLHVFLYLALAGYLLLSEGSWRLFARMPAGKKKAWLHRGLRLLLFLALYLPLLFFLPRFFISDTLLAKPWVKMIMIPGGIAAWFLYDLAYLSAKRLIHEKAGGLF